MMDERKDARTHARTDGHGQRLMPFHILRIAGAYWDKIVGGVALTRYLMFISFCSNLAQKWLSSNCEKVTKIDLRVISKCHAHLQSLTKTTVKFQKDWDKIVGEVLAQK